MNSHGKCRSILAAVVLVFSACEIQAEAVNSRWVGGEHGEWGNENDWEPQIVPDNSWWQTFAVTIDSNSIGLREVNVRLLRNRTIDELDICGDVDLLPQGDGLVKLTILDDANGLTNYGSLEIQGIGAEDMEIHGTIHLKGGRIVPLGGLSGDCNIVSEPSDYDIEELAQQE